MIFEMMFLAVALVEEFIFFDSFANIDEKVLFQTQDEINSFLVL